MPVNAASSESKESQSSYLRKLLFKQTAASPAMGELGHVPPSTCNSFILVHFGVTLRANYPSIV